MKLTKREGEVAELRKAGLTIRAIADRLGIAPSTVKKHVASAKLRLARYRAESEEARDE